MAQTCTIFGIEDFSLEACSPANCEGRVGLRIKLNAVLGGSCIGTSCKGRSSRAMSITFL
eukprot:1301503-Amphidinium_carterae.1